jgi:hypothetical protein
MGISSLAITGGAWGAEPAQQDAPRVESAAPTSQPAQEEKVADPFAFADFSWAPANYAPSETPLATKYFVPEIRLDTAYHHSFNNPADDTISGSSEVFRHGEFQITHIGFGGDVNYKNVGFRLMTQFGMYSTTTPRNDASPSRGQWQLDNAYRYISEAYATYHLDYMNDINIQAGIFMSYIGLWSYYNFDNWTYQPSYVSSNTPWFFNGVRVQFFPSDKLKIEPWLINGWQSYGKFNNAPGLGLQILYKPTGWLSILGNQYYGRDDLGDPDRIRVHTDDSVMVKYLDKPDSFVSKAAASITFDAGCESGDGVGCGDQYFVGLMAYNRLWFDHDHFGFTFGGGAIRNPGRYLVLLPPINGMTASSAAINSPFFDTGDDFWAWDSQLTADYMPTRNITFRLEFNHRWASVPYFTGPGGVTPPGGNTGNPTAAAGTPGGPPAGWTPDLSQMENRLTLAMMIRI